METIDCPECKRLFEAAREATQLHVRAESNWQIASMRRDDPQKVAGLRAVRDKAAELRTQAVDAYRLHAATHVKG